MKKLIFAVLIFAANLALADCVDPRSLGAVNGAANNTAPLQAAINYASANGATVCLPAGTWRHTGLSGASNLHIRGEGKESILLNTSSSVALDFTGDSNFTVSNLSMQGVASVTSSSPYPTVTNTGTALKISGAYGFKVSDLKISYVGTGIDYQANPSWGQQGRFADIDFEYVYKAVYTYNSGEYATFSNIHIDLSTFGIHVDSGNNVFIGAQVVRSGVAVKLSGGTNNGHGQFIGGTFNHNNYNLDVWDAVGLGESFVGCHFIAGLSGSNSGILRIMNSKGIVITGGQIGSNIIIDGGAGTASGANMIANNYIRTDLTGYAAPTISNGGVGLIKNNFDSVGLWSGNN